MSDGNYVYNNDGTFSNLVQLTGSNIDVEVVQVVNADLIPPASSKGYNFDLSKANDIRIFIAIDRNYDLNFYPKFTDVSSTSNLVTNLESLIANSIAPAAGRTHSYKPNSLPAKSGYLSITNKDASLNATVSVWVLTRKNV